MIGFIPFEKEDTFEIKAFEKETELGFCTFTIDGYNMFIKEIFCDDDIIIEGLARAAMNFAANKNAYICNADKKLFCNALDRLGFEGDKTLSVEIPEALMCGCSCHNSKPFNNIGDVQ